MLRRRSICLAAAALAGAACLGVSTSSAGAAPAPGRFFDQFSYAGMVETNDYVDLAQARRDATAVIVGRVVGAEVTRTIGDLREGGIQYIGVRVKPTEVLHKKDSLVLNEQGEVVVEFLSFGGEAKADFDRDQVGVWFLRNKADVRGYGVQRGPAPLDEGQYYRLVSSQGLFVDANGRVDNPLIRHSDGPEADDHSDHAESRPTGPRADAASEGEGYSDLASLQRAMR